VISFHTKRAPSFKLLINVLTGASKKSTTGIPEDDKNLVSKGEIRTSSAGVVCS